MYFRRIALPTLLAACLLGAPAAEAQTAPQPGATTVPNPMAGSAPARRSATPAPSAAPSAAPADTAAKKAPTAGQTAARERQRKCGAEWKEAKAAGKVAAGMKWPQYWSQCNARLKQQKA